MNATALLSLAALATLLLKLPHVPDLLGIENCQSCSSTTPYLPMLAAGYFAAFTGTALCFRSLPTPPIRAAGLVWAVTLAMTLTYFSQSWCFICLFCHAVHIAMWLTWRPHREAITEAPGVKIATVMAMAIGTTALFSTLNFTFLVYGLKLQSPVSSLVRPGATVDLSTLDQPFNRSKTLIFNFVAEHCPYCKEQIPKLDAIAAKLKNERFQFINISQKKVSALETIGPHLEWMEDHDRSLAALFGVEGYPTLVAVSPEGIIIEAAEGVAPDFEKQLARRLAQEAP